jgi:type VI protein secretion system component VasF
MRKPKSFDCVEMQHEAGRKVSQMLRAMTPEQRADYWRRETEAMRRQQTELRAEAEARGGPRALLADFAGGASDPARLRGMTAREQAAYLRERTEELRKFEARLQAEAEERTATAKR